VQDNLLSGIDKFKRQTRTGSLWHEARGHLKKIPTRNQLPIWSFRDPYFLNFLKRAIRHLLEETTTLCRKDIPNRSIRKNLLNWFLSSHNVKFSSWLMRGLHKGRLPQII